jgi:hypothetical protein
MSRSGRPSARGAHKRNLIGPHDLLKRFQAAGGVPEDVVEELGRPRPRNTRTEAANKAVVEALRGASDLLAARGIEHTGGELAGPPDPTRELAWIMSVTHSMKESVPRKKWCRHMKAADPRLSEIRTIAAISAGVWQCVECMRQAGPEALRANPWPDECDLCGATMQPGGFNEMAFNIPGCYVNCTVCDRCASFVRVED